MLRIFVSIVIMAIAITACTRQELIGNKEFITLSYQQTYCADPWKTGSNDSLTIENVTHYLDSAGLYRAGIHIKSEGGTATCQACACQTGKIIYIITLNSNSIIARYNRIGFK